MEANKQLIYCPYSEILLKVALRGLAKWCWFHIAFTENNKSAVQFFVPTWVPVKLQFNVKCIWVVGMTWVIFANEQLEMTRLSKMTWQLKVILVAVEILRVSVYFKIGFQKLFMVI